jgi:hypothetical protein
VHLLKKFFPGTIILVGLAVPFTAAAQDPASAVLPNLKLYQALAGVIADSVARARPAVDTASVRISVSPGEVRWILEEPVAKAFRNRGWGVVISDSARFLVEFGALAMNVKYENVRRPGIFASRVVDRTVRLGAQVRVADRATGVVLSAEEKSAEHADTVELSMIESLETSWVPATRGTVPAEGFLSGWAEPLIVIGSVAVAIYLLFTVRS